MFKDHIIFLDSQFDEINNQKQINYKTMKIQELREFFWLFCWLTDVSTMAHRAPIRKMVWVKQICDKIA